MDYKEAIENIDCILEHFKEFERDGVPIAYECEEKILEEAKKVMQELQMYKDSKLVLIPDVVHKKQCEELDEYKKLGTLEEVQEAVEKQKAISREIIEGKYFCPKCHNLMPFQGYCGCGQKLDWSEVE